jgi:hypothetical protein
MGLRLFLKKEGLRITRESLHLDSYAEY